MAKFNIGDKVRVKPYLIENKKYGGLILLEDMNHNQVMTIKNVRCYNDHDVACAVNEVGFIYDEEMLTLVDSYNNYSLIVNKNRKRLIFNFN